MFKHILALVVLSVLAVVLKTELAVAFQWIIGWHQHILHALASVFSSDKVGVIAQNSLALFVIPMIVVAVIALLFWITRRKTLTFLPELMWVIWLLVVALITI